MQFSMDYRRKRTDHQACMNTDEEEIYWTQIVLQVPSNRHANDKLTLTLHVRVRHAVAETE